MKNVKCLFVLFIALTLNLYSQDIDTTIKTPSIPSAFSFEKYGDIPVGLSTGTANVSIPIYSINHKGFTLPLSMSYHTSGLKVDEYNPDIGLGWNLNFGGMVSCSVKGLYDFNLIGAGNGSQNDMNLLYSHYFNGFSDPYSSGSGLPLGEGGDLINYILPPGSTYSEAASNIGYQYADGVYLNTYDGGVDIFSYYFLDKNGKFAFNGSLKPHSIPYDDVKIEKLIGEGFKITDKNGVQYYFTVQEYIENYTLTGYYISNPNDPFYNRLGNADNRNWKLSKIILLDGEEINFEYIQINYSYTSDSAIKYEHLVVNQYNISDNIQNYYSTFNVVGKRLTKITTTFDDQIINFSYDAVNNAGNEIMPLSGISVMNGTDEMKKFNFSHSYTNTSRFSLDSMNEEGLPGHVFEYNNIWSFPVRNSNKKDLWGYYNANVYSMLSKDIVDYRIFEGEDKTPNFNSTSVGSLKKITYPTGGSTEFIYEQNQYYGTEKRINEVVGGSLTFDENDYGNTVESSSFTISALSTVNINGTISRLTSYPTGFVPPPGTIIQIINTTTNNIAYQLHLTQDNVSWPYQIDEDYELDAGTYKLSVQNFVEEIEGSIGITYFDSYDYEGDLYAGGLRIKQLIDKPNASSTGIVKQYTYTDPVTGNSSGYLPGEVKTSNGVTVYSLTNSVQTPVIGIPYIKRSSNSMYDIGSVSYQFVTETLGEQKSIHEFTKFKDLLGNVDWELKPNIDFSWLRNIPLKTVYYKKDGINYFPIREEVQDYANLDYVPSPFSTFYNNSIDIYSESLIGLNVLLREPPVWNGGIYVPSIPANYTVVPYYIPTNWVYKTSTTVTQYDSQGQNPVVTEVNYYHDNPDHLQVSRTETYTSDNKTVLTTTYYPDDIKTASILQDDSTINGGAFGTTSFNAIDRMKHDDLYQIATPVQTETIVKDPNGNELSRSMQRTNFSAPLTNTNIVLPSDIETLKGTYNPTTNNLQDRIVFEEYYDNGNIKEVSKKDGTEIVYIWGYGEQYPIAKIENATFVTGKPNTVNGTQQTRINDAVAATVGETTPSTETNLINKLQLLRNDFPNALVTTYTYDPLVGVTSMTDPKGYTVYYVYDGFNRLKQVKDANGKIVSENEYHYKGQQ